jgi:hypothetical protein
LVSPDIAEGTTTILFPAWCHFAIRFATFLMRSTEPIEVPPYLCTMSAIVVLNWRRNRADASKAEPQDCRSVSRPRERYDDERWLRKRGCSVCGLPGCEAPAP